MKIVHEWLAELADVPADVETVAREISLRGFEVASVEDGVIDFEITANRPDCLNHVGIAREAAVIWGKDVGAVRERPRDTDHAQAGQQGHDNVRSHGAVLGDSRSHGAVLERPLHVTIDAPDLCPRYAARMFDVTVGPSPSTAATIST